MLTGSPEVEDADLSGVGSDRPLTYFEMMSEFCFFENVDTNYKKTSMGGYTRAIDDREDHNTHGMG